MGLSTNLFHNPVGNSPDLERILEIPRRPPLDLQSPRARALVELMTGRLGRGERVCSCVGLGRYACIRTLLPVQAWALYEAPLAGGLLAPVGVGAGKTILNILIPMVMPKCQTAVLFVPPGLVLQLKHEYLAVREHFRVPSMIFPDGTGFMVPEASVTHVVPYSRFSRADSTELLEQLQPDLIIADEIHCLKAKTSARTARVLRYFINHLDTRLCGWSGTITSNSIKDFAHLIAFALGKNSPLPLDPEQVEAWASVVDPSDWPAPPGALRRLAEPTETVLTALSRRINETRGVVSTRAETSVGASLNFRARPIKAPERILALLRDLRKSWTRPDGEELIESVSVARCARQLTCGFYYKWVFPGAPANALIEEWFAARKAWNRELRDRLKAMTPHLDSKQLCTNAAERFYAKYEGPLPVWAAQTWPRWRAVKDQVKYDVVPVWVDDYLIDDVSRWLADANRVLWYEFRAFGLRMAEKGWTVYSGGPDAKAAIREEKGDRSIVLSIDAHHEGLDGLQHLYSEQMIAADLSSGKEYEQLLGRLHRIGQKAESVDTWVYRHTPEMTAALDKAIRVAKYIEGITTVNQKLLAANLEFDI